MANAATYNIVFTGLDKASAVARSVSSNIGRSISKISAAVAPLKTDFAAFAESTGWSGVAEKVDGIGKKFSGLHDQLGALAGPLGALGGGLAVGGLVEIAKNASEYGAQIYDASIKTGVAVDQLQRLHYIAGQEDVPIEQMDKALEHLNYQIGQAASGHNKQALGMFNALGIRLKDNNGHLRTAESVFGDLSEAVQKNTNATLRAEIVGQAFGQRMGPQLLPVLALGRQRIRELGEEVDRLRGPMTEAGAKSAKEAQESWKALSAAASGLANSIGSQLIPVILPLVKGLTGLISAHRGLATTVGLAAGSLAALGLIAGPVWTTLSLGTSVALALGKSFIWLAVKAFPNLMLEMATMTATSLPGLSAAFLGLGAAIEATPIGWILTGIAAVAGAVFLIYHYWDRLPAFFSAIWRGIVDFFHWGWDNILPLIPGLGIVRMLLGSWEHVPHSLSVIWEAIVGAFRSGWDKIVAGFHEVWNRVAPIIEPILEAMGLVADKIGGALGTASKVATTVTHTVVNKVVTLAAPVISKAASVAQSVAAASDAGIGALVPEIPSPAKVAGNVMQRAAAAMNAAIASQKKWGIPAAVTFAQWKLESASGAHMPAGSNNPFGIKATAGQPFVLSSTLESIHGHMTRVVAKFAKFASLTDAFDAHAKLLATSSHYAGARAHEDDPLAFANALTGIYATDPNYGSKLGSIIQSTISRPLIGGAQAAPAPKAGKLDVSVRLANLPAGTRTQVTPQGDTISSLDVGRSFANT